MSRHVLFCSIMLFLISYQVYSGVKDKEGEPGDKILATVGSHKIILSVFSSRYTDYLIASGIDDKNMIRESILNNMINEVVLFNYDDNSKIFNNVEYQRELEASKKETILAYLKDQEVYKNISASDKEIREAFVRANEKIAARHLYAKTKEKADELYQLLQKGVSFDSLAKQVFTDSVLKNNGGYLGYFTWGDMDTDFEDAAYSLKIGEISKPVKTAYGYSVIKVEDKVQRPLLTENEYLNKKDHLAQVVRMRKMKPYERAYLKSVLDIDEIKFNDDVTKDIYSNLKFAQSNEFIKSAPGFAVCASYKGNKYLKKNIVNEINQLPVFQRDKINNIEDLEAVIKGLILQNTLYKIAVSKGYDKVNVVKATFKKLETDLFMKYKTSEIAKNSPVSDSLVYEYYKDNINSFLSPREINAKELVVDNKKLADSLKIRAEMGADFNGLINEFSLDKKGEKFSNLDNYGFLKDTLWNSPTGEITGPFNIKNYFVLFQVIGKKDGTPVDFNQVKDRVTMALKKQMSQSLLNKYTENLRKSVNIRINYDVLWNYKISGLSYKGN